MEPHLDQGASLNTDGFPDFINFFNQWLCNIQSDADLFPMVNHLGLWHLYEIMDILSGIKAIDFVQIYNKWLADY